MSKIIRLLNKSKEFSANPSSSLGDSLIREQEESPDRAYPIIYSVSLTLMAFVAIIAVTSLVVSYKAFNQMQLSQQVSSRLAGINSQQQEKINDLEDALVKLTSSDAKRLDDLNDTLQGLRKDIVNSQGSVEEIILQHKNLKTVIESLKNNDRVLLDKFLMLNKNVVDLKNNLTVEGKE